MRPDEALILPQIWLIAPPLVPSAIMLVDVCHPVGNEVPPTESDDDLLNNGQIPEERRQRKR